MYAGFLHDAVVLYALAVHDRITLGGNFTDGRELMKHMTNRSFEGGLELLIILYSHSLG